jgi:uncharacterized membrane protein YfcA
MADLILLAVGLVVVTATSLAVVFVNSVSGSVAYAYQRRIDYRSGLILAVATVPGSVVGALLTQRIPRGLFTLGFSAVLVAIAVLLVRRPAARERTGGDPTAGQRRVLVDRLGQIYVYSLPLARAIPISAGIGLLSSLLGIGGGFIQVPVFILVFGFPTYIATATSQFMLAVMSLSGTLTHALTGEVGEAGRRTLILAPGVIIGAQFGAWLSRRMRPAAIARLLAVLLILVAVRTMVGQLLG